MRLIYFSPVKWASFTQRPHEFVQAFHAQTGGDVVWVEPYPTRLPRLDDFFRLTTREKEQTRELPDWITLVAPRVLPVEPLPLLNQINSLAFNKLLRQLDALFTPETTMLAIGKPSGLALSALAYLNPPCSVYDAMDDFPQFYTGISEHHLKKIENKIISRVKRVLVSSTNLKNKVFEAGVESDLILNACSSFSIESLKSVLRVANKRPVLGYIGTIAKWFDWGFVIKLAEAMPNCEVRLIGPLLTRVPAELPSNLILLPSLPHSEALKAMMQFDVGLIPFKESRLTHYVDPIKYYEYRALGLPVVSTRFGEMTYRNTEEKVYLLDSDSDFKKLIENLLKNKSAPIIDVEFISKNSWHSRFNEFFKLFI